jgi:hypothetical protein
MQEKPTTKKDLWTRLDLIRFDSLDSIQSKIFFSTAWCQPLRVTDVMVWKTLTVVVASQAVVQEAKQTQPSTWHQSVALLPAVSDDLLGNNNKQLLNLIALCAHKRYSRTNNNQTTTIAIQ